MAVFKVDPAHAIGIVPGGDLGGETGTVWDTFLLCLSGPLCMAVSTLATVRRFEE